jgi:hypothetical protein
MLTTIALLLYRLGLFSVWFVQQAEVSDFDDLGIWLLAGFAVAVALAIALTIIRMKFQAKRPPSPGFISINSFTERKDQQSSPRDK